MYVFFGLLYSGVLFGKVFLFELDLENFKGFKIMFIIIMFFFFFENLEKEVVDNVDD